jgi:hypothetical protein
MTRKPQAFVLDSGKDEPKLKTAGTRTRIAFEPEPPQQELAVVPPSSASLDARPRGMGWGRFADFGPDGACQSLGRPRHHTAGGRISSPAHRRWAGWCWPWPDWPGLAALPSSSVKSGASPPQQHGRVAGTGGPRHQPGRAISPPRRSNQGLNCTLYTAAVKDLAWPMKEFRSSPATSSIRKTACLLADRLLMEPLDEAAHRIIARRARRVTLLTTVTPAAALDISVRRLPEPGPAAGDRRALRRASVYARHIQTGPHGRHPSRGDWRPCTL